MPWIYNEGRDVGDGREQQLLTNWREINWVNSIKNRVNGLYFQRKPAATKQDVARFARYANFLKSDRVVDFSEINLSGSTVPVFVTL